jgi:hypothetical protein
LATSEALVPSRLVCWLSRKCLDTSLHHSCELRRCAERVQPSGSCHQNHGLSNPRLSIAAQISHCGAHARSTPTAFKRERCRCRA